MCTHTKRTETPHFTMGIRVTTITTFSSLCLFLKLYALSHTGMPSPPKSTGCRGEMKRVERDRGSSSLVPAHWAPQLPISLKQHCLLMKRISALWSWHLPCEKLHSFILASVCSISGQTTKNLLKLSPRKRRKSNRMLKKNYVPESTCCWCWKRNIFLSSLYWSA